MRTSAFLRLTLAIVLGAGAGVLPLSASAQQPPTLEKVKSSGVIALAYRESSLPFSYLGEDGQPRGFGWEICAKVVDQVKKTVGRSDLKVVTQSVTSQNRIPLLQNGTIDIECGSTTNNAERSKQVAFAINYFYTGTRFIVKSDSSIRSIDDLKARKVVSTVGTSNMLVLRKANNDRNLDFSLMGAKDHAESLLLVQQGRADAFGMDDILLYGLRANLPRPSEVAVVGDAIQVEPYAIMLRKDDPAFKKLVDETLVGLINSGEFETLYRKWFQSPIPPKGVNLNVPMSKELRQNLRDLSDKPA